MPKEPLIKCDYPGDNGRCRLDPSLLVSRTGKVCTPSKKSKCVDLFSTEYKNEEVKSTDPRAWEGNYYGDGCGSDFIDD